MNNFELFNFEPNLSNNYHYLDNSKKDVKELYKDLENVKPIDIHPDKLYRDDFMEQDIEIDIDSNKFRDIWSDYALMYNEKNIPKMNNEIKDKPIILNKVTYEDDLKDLTLKVKELDKYVLSLKACKKDLTEKEQLLELSKKELEQEKELFQIEKDKFEEYRKEEKEKIDKDKINFQNMIEDLKNKIDNILN